ncbi:MAG: GNAT family N-acetyltransferase [Candidatus Bathyarchaeota archaeon]|nr:GNAT family N-acetyltransferase [Candidatus Bathyarchaeota archaeon]
MAKETTPDAGIKYVSGDQTLLPQIKPLWEALNLYHTSRSTHFKGHYRGMTFEKRVAVLLKKSVGGELHLELALDQAAGRGVGYVVCSFGGEGVGEVDSVFVEEAYRGRGIGDKLMKNTLAWMEQRGALKKTVEVSVGNEAAWGFYGRYGFLPRKTVLEQT